MNDNKLRQLAQGASEGPWTYCADTDAWGNDQWRIGNLYDVAQVRRYGDAEKDAAFIAAANPEAVLALLDEIDALREGRARYPKGK